MQLACPNGGSFYYMTMGSVISGHGCSCKKCCPNIHPKTTEEARAQVIALGCTPGPDFKYEGANIKMQLACRDCNCFYFVLMHNIVKGFSFNCKKCSLSKLSKTTEEARAQVIALGCTPGPDFKYENNKSKMQLVCPNNNFYMMRMDGIVAGYGCECDKCHGFKRERRCREWFENKFQKTFQKVKPKWLRNQTGRCLELDGYCEELKIAFEHNGEQHYAHYEKFHKTTKKFEDQQRRDELKMKLCAEQGVKLVVIPYWEKNVENFLEKQFANM
jgi:hypothetical protein